MGLLHTASVLHDAELTLCNAFMPNQTIAGSNDASGRQAGQSSVHISMNRSHLHFCVKNLAQGWWAPAVGDGQAGNTAPGSFDGMRWAQAACGRLRSTPSTWAGVGVHPLRLTAAYWEAGVVGQRRRTQAANERRSVRKYNAEDWDDDVSVLDM